VPARDLSELPRRHCPQVVGIQPAMGTTALPLDFNPQFSNINFQMDTLYYGDNLDILRRYEQTEMS
jgi:hypothetical protein